MTALQDQTVYRGLWAVLVQYFRVPQDPPEIPGGGRDNTSPFKPAQAFLGYLKFWFWMLMAIIDIGVLVGWIAIMIADWRIGLAVLPIVVIVLIAPTIVAYIALQLRFDTTWYIMTDRALRIRRGVWIIDERTITYENIQNVKVTQGPVQRHFKIATVVVETAGAGSAGGKQRAAAANQGALEGVTNASEIRDRILLKMRESGSTGLGDELSLQQQRGRAASWSPAQFDLLREIHKELAAIA